MSLAYITGGQYVPMVNAKLLAKVIIGGVREEISLERLMQDAQADINHEMQQAEAEGATEDEVTARVNRMLVSKKARVRQMDNLEGQVSSVAREKYSKCADMSEMRSRYTPVASEATSSAYGSRSMMLSATTLEGESPVVAMASMTYALKEGEEVSMAQTERIVQRMRSKKEASGFRR